MSIKFETLMENIRAEAARVVEMPPVFEWSFLSKGTLIATAQQIGRKEFAQELLDSMTADEEEE